MSSQSIDLRKSLKDSYGWRKFWNIQVRRTETDFSGKPRCGLQTWWFLRFSCWRRQCWWKIESSWDFSLPLSKTDPIMSIFLLILSLRFLYKKEMVWSANRVCSWGSNSVAAWNADTTVCISSTQWLYRSSTRRHSSTRKNFQ